MAIVLFSNAARHPYACGMQWFWSAVFAAGAVLLGASVIVPSFWLELLGYALMLLAAVQAYRDRLGRQKK
jgi:hypothetical protein